MKPDYIIADDFTGANDIGVRFIEAGCKPSVILDSSLSFSLSDDKPYIFCTDSRDDEPQKAKRKIEELLTLQPQLLKEKLLVKKVDSTLRGNIGGEISSLVKAGFSLAIVAICAPKAGRKTLKGCCYVHGEKLIDTEFASDPKSPISSSHISHIIQSQLENPVAELWIDDIRSHELSYKIEQYYKQGYSVIVCDAENIEDLRLIYETSYKLKHKTLFVTTGEIGDIFPIKTNIKAPNILPQSKPTLLGVIGSMSGVTRSQIDYVIQNNYAKAINLDIDKILGEKSHDYSHYLSQEISQYIQKRQHLFIRTSWNEQQRHEIAHKEQQYQISRQDIGNHIKLFLANLTQQVFQKERPTDLLVCGGDIALAVCQKLNINQIFLKGLIDDSIPWGCPADKNIHNLQIFTKAGGFGDKKSFAQLIQFLEN